MPGVSVQVGPPLVDLLFDQPAATDANWCSGRATSPRDDVVVLANPRCHCRSSRSNSSHRRGPKCWAELPGLTVRTLVLRPSVPFERGGWRWGEPAGVVFTGEVRYYVTHPASDGRPGPSHHWQAAAQTEGWFTTGPAGRRRHACRLECALSGAPGTAARRPAHRLPVLSTARTTEMPATRTSAPARPDVVRPSGRHAPFELAKVCSRTRA